MEMGHWVGVGGGGSDTVPTTDQQMFMECAARWNPPEGHVYKDSAEVCPRLLPTHGTEKCGRPHSQIIRCQNVGTSSKGSHVFPQALE